MSRQTFKLLVVVNQVLWLLAMIVNEMNDDSATSVSESIFYSESLPPLDDFPYWLAIAIMLAGLVAAAGLCLERRWGRTLFVVTFVATVITTPLSELYVSWSWGALFSYLGSTSEGMILALAFFSPVRRMFESPAEPDDETETSAGESTESSPSLLP